MTFCSWIVVFLLVLMLKYVYVTDSNVTNVKFEEPLVSYGIPYDTKKHPYVVSILTGKTGVCTGSLIRPLFVITAAHCTWMKNTKKLSVFRGHYANYNENAGIKRNVRTFYQHEDYHKTANPHPDLSLLEITSEYREITNYIEIGGHPNDFLNSREVHCIGIGFGKTETQKLPKNVGLQYHAVARYGPNACINSNQKFWQNYLCMKPSKKQTCAGDSGGPTICKGKLYATVKGHYNYIENHPQEDVCGDINIMTRHVFLYMHRDWISSIVGPLGDIEMSEGNDSDDGEYGDVDYDDEAPSKSIIIFNQKYCMLLHMTLYTFVLQESWCKVFIHNM